jgi:acetyltransferase-like isoleucine patch superfamily enzyme
MKNILYKLSPINPTGLFNWVLNFFPGIYFTNRYVRVLLARIWGMHLGRQCAIFKNVFIYCPKNVRIGNHVLINQHIEFDAIAPISIGSNVVLGPHILFITGTHQQGSHEKRALAPYGEPITIGDGCWLGARVIIGPGVNIGAGSIVSTGSVVMHSMPPDSLIAGNPARRIKQLDP